MIGGGQMLRPILDPLHGPPQLVGGERDQEILGIELAAHAETAAYIRLDEMDSILIDCQMARQDCPVGVGYFGWPPDPQLAVGGVVIGD